MSARLWYFGRFQGKNPLPGSCRTLAEIGCSRPGTEVLLSLLSYSQPLEAACLPWPADSFCIFTSSRDGPNPPYTVNLRLPLLPRLCHSTLSARGSWRRFAACKDSGDYTGPTWKTQAHLFKVRPNSIRKAPSRKKLDPFGLSGGDGNLGGGRGSLESCLLQPMSASHSTFALALFGVTGQGRGLFV